MPVLLLLLTMMADKIEMIQGTAGSRAGVVELKGGGLVVREGETGAAFGTLQVGKGKRRIGYFLVLKSAFPGTGKSESNEDVAVSDNVAVSRHNLTLGGKAMAFVHTVRLAGRGLASESFTVGSNKFDPARGRVFLVDMTVSPPRLEQRKLDLPAETVDLGTKKAAAEAARSILASLAKQDRKAKAFIESGLPKR